jgi:hypothetical protein
VLLYSPHYHELLPSESLSEREKDYGCLGSSGERQPGLY